MKSRLDEQTIALRAANEFEDESYVNLGYGMPALCGEFVPEEKGITFQSENGVLGYGRLAYPEERNDYLINASGQPVIPQPGMCFFNHAESFDMIRGGHIDLVVLGAFQVSEKGDLANWGLPQRPAVGMGGGMDLAVGAKRVIVTMEHTTKEGKPKIVKECTDYPLTGKECVDLLITDIAVIEVSKQGLVLKELAPGWTVEEVQALTEPRLIIAPDVKEIEL